MRAQEVKGLMEAYSKVYEPNIIDIAAEIWVSACIEEGADFSQHTLDEITEAFIEDMSSEDLSESLLSEILGMPGAQDFGAKLRQGFGQARRAVGGAIGNVARGAVDVAGAGAQGLAGQKTTSKNPLARAANLLSRGQTAIPRAAASFGAGVLTGKGGTPAASATPTKSRFAGARDAAFAKAKTIKGSPVVGPKPTPTTSTSTSRSSSAPKPAATAAPKPATPAPNTSLTKASSALSGAGALAPKPKPQSDVGAMIARSQQRQADQTPKPAAPAPAKRALGGARERMLNQSFDVFDLVKGYLLDEGYADSEDAAMVIMVNMSEEWRETILESCGVEFQLSEVLDTPEKANKYGKKALGSMLGATAKALITKNKKYVKTVEKRTKGVEAAKRKAEKKSKEEQNEEYVNEDLEALVNQLIAEGYDLSEYTWEEIAEIYSEELELGENRRMAADPEGRKSGYSNQPDPSKEGFTGIGNMSIKQIMALNKKIATKKKED